MSLSKIQLKSEGYHFYRINKGRHFCSIKTRKLFNITYKPTHLFIETILTDSCIYTLPNLTDQEDLNKIYGVSWGLHHHYSIRLSFMYNTTSKNIDYYAYWYNRYQNKTFNYQYLGSIDLKKQRIIAVSMDFDYENNKIVIRDYTNLVNRITEIPFKYPKIKLGYVLQPYFGGEPYSAPQNIDLYVRT